MKLPSSNLIYFLSALFIQSLATSSIPNSNTNSQIDRQGLVSLYNPIRTSSNPTTPIQIGNGNFAFGTDITSLQTFLPFNTLSSWGWKNDSLPLNVTQSDISAYKGVSWLNHGRPVQYDFNGNNKEIEQWLISNPNRVNLGRIGLVFLDDKNGVMNVTEEDLKNPRQILDLWSGTITSTFSIQNTSITIKVASSSSSSSSSSPTTNTIAIHLKSNLLSKHQLGLFLDFPWCDGTSKFNAPFVGNFDNFQTNHTTTLQTLSPFRNIIQHTLDSATFVTTLNGDAHTIQRNDLINHKYTVLPHIVTNTNHDSQWTLTVTFSKSTTTTTEQTPQAEDIFKESEKVWEDYWSNGGFVDVLTGSTDTRANELQRRIILSMYLMRVNEAGDTPPQEVKLPKRILDQNLRTEFFFRA